MYIPAESKARQGEVIKYYDENAENEATEKSQSFLMVFCATIQLLKLIIKKRKSTSQKWLLLPFTDVDEHLR